jgi:hypothetical protein
VGIDKIRHSGQPKICPLPTVLPKLGTVHPPWSSLTLPISHELIPKGRSHGLADFEDRSDYWDALRLEVRPFSEYDRFTRVTDEEVSRCDVVIYDYCIMDLFEKLTE